MPHDRPVASALLAVCLACAPAQARAATRTMSDVPLPGGLAAARAALGDRTPVSAALFLCELVERFYNTPKQTDANQDARFQAFLAYLERAVASGGPSDALPLPVTSEWWVHTVLGGRSTPPTLVLDILRSRDAALLYRALVAFDDETRAWFAGQPALLREVLAGRGALLVLAAPGIRVSGERLVTPGGEVALRAWEHLLGVSASDPDVFVRRLIAQDEGALAYFYGRMGRMPDGQVAALVGAAGDAERDGLERLYRVYRHAGLDWRAASRPFSAMPQDPSLLVAELPRDAVGRAVVPGTPEFWMRVFGVRGEPSSLASEDHGRFAGETTDAAWLAERVYRDGPAAARARTGEVLLASRVLGPTKDVKFSDALVMTAALPHYPALVLTLERLGVTDPAVYRAAIARAAALAGVQDLRARGRSVAQFQGVLALLIQATRAGAIGPGEASNLVSSLAGLAVGEGGDYEGRMARWIDEHLRPASPGSADEAVDSRRPRLVYDDEDRSRRPLLRHVGRHALPNRSVPRRRAADSNASAASGLCARSPTGGRSCLSPIGPRARRQPPRFKSLNLCIGRI